MDHFRQACRKKKNGAVGDEEKVVKKEDKDEEGVVGWIQASEESSDDKDQSGDESEDDQLVGSFTGGMFCGLSVVDCPCGALIDDGGTIIDAKIDEGGTRGGALHPGPAL